MILVEFVDGDEVRGLEEWVGGYFGDEVGDFVVVGGE